MASSGSSDNQEFGSVKRRPRSDRGLTEFGPPIDVELYKGHLDLTTEVDKKVKIVLQDGKVFIGTLQSVDQFANLLLNDTVERIHVGKRFGDIYRGIMVVRGDTLLLFGEVRDDINLEQVSAKDILNALDAETEERETKEARLQEALKRRGVPSFGRDY